MIRPSPPVLTSRRGPLARMIVCSTHPGAALLPGQPITLASQRRAYAWRLAVVAVVLLAVVVWRGL